MRGQFPSFTLFALRMNAWGGSIVRYVLGRQLQLVCHRQAKKA
jgi:hypothetical protein